jgi:hypothetical protein
MPAATLKQQLLDEEKDLLAIAWEHGLEFERFSMLAKGFPAKEVNNLKSNDFSAAKVKDATHRAKHSAEHMTLAYPSMFTLDEALLFSYRYQRLHMTHLTETLAKSCESVLKKPVPVIRQTYEATLEKLNETAADHVEGIFVETLKKDGLSPEKTQALCCGMSRLHIRSNEWRQDEEKILVMMAETAVLEKEYYALRDHRERKFKREQSHITAEARKEVFSNQGRKKLHQRMSQHMGLVHPQILHFAQNALEVTAVSFECAVQEHEHDKWAQDVDLAKKRTPHNRDEDKAREARSWAEKRQDFVTNCTAKTLDEKDAAKAWDILYGAYNRRDDRGGPSFQIIEIRIPFGPRG